MAGLLRIKYNNVEVEKRLTATTSDIFYIENSAMFPIRIAVECKDWASPLNSADLSKIFSLYKSSIDSNEIDKILIISRHELGQSPSESLARMPNTKYMQYDVFTHNLMDFQLLLQNNVAAFENHEASKNFIQPRCKGKSTVLCDEVYEWISRENAPVSMVYGGYGLGKTSFSHYLASELSKKYRENNFDRIPIRIPLGGLFTKQDLQALICSELTGVEGRPAVGNFAYDIFHHMVRRGAILLILDGFDEMKHAMLIEDFEFTFEQMSPLFEGNSKVIILGRPDAFFDAEEEDRIITSLLASTAFVNDTIEKFEVDQFTREEVDKYLAHFCKENKISGNEKNFISDLKEREYEILARPVQLNMFTKIISSLSKTADIKLTRYRLYLEFVKRFVRRESEKKARSVTDNHENIKFGYDDPRSKFMQNIAWWILTERRENRFLPSDIPNIALPTELRLKKSRIASIREALIGSIVEHTDKTDSETGLIGKKGANYFYFPHKSYMEFLVSQYFCREEFTKEMYRQFFNYANPEMISFVREGPNVGAQNIELGLEYVLGNVPREVIQIASTSYNFIKYVESESLLEISHSRKYLAYEYFTLNNKFENLEKLILIMHNKAYVNKSISAYLILTGDYLLKHNTESFACRLIAQSLDNLPNLLIEEILRGDRVERYPDSNFLNSAILFRYLRVDRDGIWKFDPGNLHSDGIRMSGNSMYCDGYGNFQGNTLNDEIMIDTDRVKEFVRTSDAKKIQLAETFLGMKSIPTLKIAGRLAEFIT